MLEILVSILATLFLAKHTGSRGRYNLHRVRVTTEKALATLASDTALKQTLTGTSSSEYRLVTAKIAWALVGLTAGEGPITVGFSHSDYTVLEIKECLESQSSISQGDKIATEQANRLVRVVGILSEANSSLNDGRPIKTRLNWRVQIGQSVDIFIWNESTGALTTGAFVNVAGDIWVKWL